MKFNTKGWKKIHSDKHTTTIRNDQGHEIKMAHSAMSPKHRGLLQQIEVHPDSEIALPKKEIDSRDWGGQPADKQSSHHNKNYSAGGETFPGDEPHKSHKETGVHKSPSGSGNSIAGSLYRAGRKGYQNSKEAGIEKHKKVLEELKEMPKPKLYAYGGNPKLEESQKLPPKGKLPPEHYADGNPEVKNYTPEEAATPATSLDSAFQATPVHTAEELAKIRAETDSYNTKPTTPTEDVSGPTPELGDKYIEEKTDPEADMPAKEEKSEPTKAVAESPIKKIPPDVMETRKIYNELVASQADSGGDLLGHNYGGGRAASQQFTPDYPTGNPVGGAPKNFNADIWDQAKDENEKRKLASAEKDTEVATTNAKRAEAGLPPIQAPGVVPTQQPDQTSTTQTTGQQQGTQSQQTTTDDQDPYAANMEKTNKTNEDILAREKWAAEETQRINQAQAVDVAHAEQNTAEEKAYYAQQMHSDMQDNLEQSNLIAHDIATGHIDVDQFWKEQKLPQVIANTLGILVSGLGAASAGQENAAMKYLNSQVQANIEGQKTTMHEKGSVLNSLLHQYGNERDAVTAFNIASDSVLQNELKKIGAERGDQKSQVALQQAYSAIEQRKQALALTLTVNRMLMKSFPGNMQNGQSQQEQSLPQSVQDEHVSKIRNSLKQIAELSSDTPEGKKAAERLKTLDEQYVDGVGWSSKPVDKPIRDQLQEIQKFKYTLGAYKDFVQEHPYFTMWGSSDKSKAEALTGQLQQQYRAATDEGQPTSGKMHFITGQVPPADKFLSEYYNMPKIGVLMNKALADENIIKKQAGFNVKPPIPQTKRK